MEDVRIYDVCLTKKEVLLAKAIIAEKLKKEFTQDVFSLYDNFLISVGDEWEDLCWSVNEETWYF